MAPKKGIKDYTEITENEIQEVDEELEDDEVVEESEEAPEKEETEKVLMYFDEDELAAAKNNPNTREKSKDIELFTIDQDDLDDYDQFIENAKDEILDSIVVLKNTIAEIRTGKKVKELSDQGLEVDREKINDEICSRIDNGEDKLFNVVSSFEDKEIESFCSTASQMKNLDDFETIISMDDNKMTREFAKVEKAFGDMFAPNQYDMLNLNLVGVKSPGTFADPDFLEAEQKKKEINLGKYVDIVSEETTESLIAGCLLRDDVLGELAPRTFSSLESIKGGELEPKGETNLDKMLDPLFNNTVGGDNRRNANMSRLAVPKARKMAEVILEELKNDTEEGKIAFVEALENTIRVAGKYAQNCTENDHRLYASSKLVYNAMKVLEQPKYRIYSTLSKSEVEKARTICSSYECQLGMLDNHNEAISKMIQSYCKNKGKFVPSDEVYESVKNINSRRYILEGQVQYSKNHPDERRITDNEFLCALDSDGYSDLLGKKKEVNQQIEYIHKTENLEDYVENYKEYFEKNYQEVETVHFDSKRFNDKLDNICDNFEIALSPIKDVSPVKQYMSKLDKLYFNVTKNNKHDYAKLEVLEKQRDEIVKFMGEVGMIGEGFDSKFGQAMIQAHRQRDKNSKTLPKIENVKGHVYGVSDVDRPSRLIAKSEGAATRKFLESMNGMLAELDRVIAVRRDELEVVKNVVQRDKLASHLSNSGKTGIDKMQNFASKSGMNLSRSTLGLREKVFEKNKAKSRFEENRVVINQQLKNDFEAKSVKSGASGASSKISRISSISSASRMSTMSKAESSFKESKGFYEDKSNIEKAKEYNPILNKDNVFAVDKNKVKKITIPETLPEISKIKSLDKINKKPNLSWGGKFSMLVSRDNVLDDISNKLSNYTKDEFKLSQAQIDVQEKEVKDHFYKAELEKAKKLVESEIKNTEEQLEKAEKEEKLKKEQNKDNDYFEYGVEDDEYDLNQYKVENTPLTKYDMEDMSYAVKRTKGMRTTGNAAVDYVISNGVEATKAFGTLIDGIKLPGNNQAIDNANMQLFDNFNMGKNGEVSKNLVSLIMFQNLVKFKNENNSKNWTEKYNLKEETIKAYTVAKKITKTSNYREMYNLFEPKDQIKKERMDRKRAELEERFKKCSKLFQETGALFPKEQMQVIDKAIKSCDTKAAALHFSNTTVADKMFITKTLRLEDETGETYKKVVTNPDAGLINIMNAINIYNKQLKKTSLDDKMWGRGYNEDNYDLTHDNLMESFPGWDKKDEERALDFLLEKSSFDLDEVNKYFNTVVRTVNKSKDPSKKVMVNVTRLDELKQQRKQVFASNIAKNEKNIQEREKSKLEEYKNKFIKLSEERNKKAKEEQKLKEEKEKARIAKEKAEQEEKLKKEQEEKQRKEQEEKLKKEQEEKLKKETKDDLEAQFKKGIDKLGKQNEDEVQSEDSIDTEGLEQAEVDDIIFGEENPEEQKNYTETELNDNSTEIRKNLDPHLTYLKGMKFKSESLNNCINHLEMLNNYTGVLYGKGLNGDDRLRIKGGDVYSLYRYNEDALKSVDEFLSKENYTSEEKAQIDRMMELREYLRKDNALLDKLEVSNNGEYTTIYDLVEHAKEKDKFALGETLGNVNLNSISQNGEMRIAISYTDESITKLNGYIFPLSENMNPQNAERRIFNDNLFFYKMSATEEQKQNVNAILNSGYQAFNSVFDEDGDIIEGKAKTLLEKKNIDVDKDFDWKKFSSDMKKIKSDIDYQASVSEKYYNKSQRILARGRNIAYNSTAKSFGVGNNVPISRIVKIKNGNEEMNVGFEQSVFDASYEDISGKEVKAWANEKEMPKVTPAFLAKAMDIEAYNYIVGFDMDYSNMGYSFIRAKDNSLYLDDIMIKNSGNSFSLKENSDDFKKLPAITERMASIIKAYTPEKLKLELGKFGLGEKEISSALTRLNNAKNVISDIENKKVDFPKIVRDEEFLNMSIEDLAKKNELTNSKILKEVYKICDPKFIEKNSKAQPDKPEYNVIKKAEEIPLSKKDAYMNPIESMRSDLKKADSFFHINSTLYNNMSRSLNKLITDMGVSNSVREETFKKQYEDLLRDCKAYVKERGKTLPSSKLGKDRLFQAAKIGKFVERRLEIVNVKEARTNLAKKIISMSSKNQVLEQNSPAYNNRVNQILSNDAFLEMTKGKTSKEISDMTKMEPSALTNELRQANLRTYESNKHADEKKINVVNTYKSNMIQ